MQSNRGKAIELNASKMSLFVLTLLECGWCWHTEPTSHLSVPSGTSGEVRWRPQVGIVAIHAWKEKGGRNVWAGIVGNQILWTQPTSCMQPAGTPGAEPTSGRKKSYAFISSPQLSQCHCTHPETRSSLPGITGWYYCMDCSSRNVEYGGEHTHTPTQPCSAKYDLKYWLQGLEGSAFSLDWLIHWIGLHIQLEVRWVRAVSNL